MGTKEDSIRIPAAVTLMLRVRLADGKRPHYPAATYANGRFKPLTAVVQSQDVHFPDGTYYLRYTQPGGKRVYDRVVSEQTKPEGLAADALTAKRQKEAQLRAIAVGLEPGTATLVATPRAVVQGKQSGRLKLADMVVEYVKAKSKNARTGKAYATELNQFLKLTRKVYADELTRSDFRAYVLSLEKTAKSPKTIHNRLTTLKAFLNFHDLDASVVNRKDWPKAPKKLAKKFKPQQIAALLDASSPEDRIIWEFFLASGCREQEVMFSKRLYCSCIYYLVRRAGVKRKILITGATGQVGSRTINGLLGEKEVQVVAAVRSPTKQARFTNRGIATVVLDLDDERTHLPALQSIDTLFVLTGYTVDMLRQSKALLDNASKAGVRHVVHLGACGRNDTTVAHWAWHQFVERYIEWAGFSFTHLRPETFMQNLLSYGGEKTIKNGVINAFVEDARLSWVDVEDVAQVAALALAHPELHGGKTYRLGYDAMSFGELADLMTGIVGQPFRYDPLPPEIFLEAMRSAGAEMTYMTCVYDHWKRYAAGTIPGADDTFDNFPEITGKQPARLAGFVERHKAEFSY